MIIGKVGWLLIIIGAYDYILVVWAIVQDDSVVASFFLIRRSEAT